MITKDFCSTTGSIGYEVSSPGIEKLLKTISTLKNIANHSG
eukprot:gene12873-7296_t